MEHRNDFDDLRRAFDEDDAENDVVYYRQRHAPEPPEPLTVAAVRRALLVSLRRGEWQTVAPAVAARAALGWWFAGAEAALLRWAVRGWRLAGGTRVAELAWLVSTPLI